MIRPFIKLFIVFYNNQSYELKQKVVIWFDFSFRWRITSIKEGLPVPSPSAREWIKS